MIISKKIQAAVLVFTALIVFWFWANREDYIQTDYRYLSASQQQLFQWQDGDDSDKLIGRYSQHFADSMYSFPGKKVTQIKRFRNTPIISGIWSQKLKAIYINEFIQFFNDTTNFHWSETTNQISESEYYFSFYNEDNKVVGKVYYCGDGCHMTSSIPFTPRMKFGGLSERGITYLEQILSEKTKWE